MFFSYIGSSGIIGIVLLILFAILQWLNIPAGNLIDWGIGIASFWWLMVIVTVPWNIYFDAREVIAEANTSKQKEITVDEGQIEYAEKISRWSIIVAIALHIISAIVLYWLAAIGVSSVGYFSCAATLLLTILRPSIRTYEYLAYRLKMIREQILYPREDILELRSRFDILESSVKYLQEQIDPLQGDSWAGKQQREWEILHQESARLRANLEQLQANNEVEHEKLSREAKSAIAQITEDGQFLNHVREIIRFFKAA